MNILIVEDHESVAAGIAHSLRDEGYQVSICDSALAAIDRLAGARFDLLILDINLKLSSGLDVLQHARTKRLPLAIIILSARNTVDQRIAALDLGADDYLSKPFVMSELLARVRVQARRVAPTAQPEETIGRLTYSPSLRSVRISETDEPIKLTKKELAVFECLLAHRACSYRNHVGHHSSTAMTLISRRLWLKSTSPACAGNWRVWLSRSKRRAAWDTS